jgi:hypothetical protein
LFDLTWEEASGADLRALAHRAVEYRYSSIGEYARKKFVITAPQHFPKFVYGAKNPDALLKMWQQNRKKQNRTDVK